MLKILHTADIHLGAKLSYMESRADLYRQTIVETFESIYDQAVKNKVDLVVFAGDIFDTPYPSKITIEIVKKLFKKLSVANIYVAVVPGNHDYLVKGGVYDTADLAHGDMKIIVFKSQDRNIARIKELDLSIYAKPNTLQKSKQSPLPTAVKAAGEDEMTKTQYHIAIAHGSADVKGKKAENYPITSEEIAGSGFDYIALGDWHRVLNVSAGKTKAFYPGSPEPLAIDQSESGYALIIELGNGETKVKPIKIGQINILNVEIDSADFNKDKENGENYLQAIENKIEAEFKKLGLPQGGVNKTKTVLNLNFTGTITLENSIRIEEIIEYFSNQYMFVTGKDLRELQLTEKDLSQYPDYTIIGRFIKYIQDKQNIDSKLKNEALQKGIGMLLKNGKK